MAEKKKKKTKYTSIIIVVILVSYSLATNVRNLKFNVETTNDVESSSLLLSRTTVDQILHKWKGKASNLAIHMSPQSPSSQYRYSSSSLPVTKIKPFVFFHNRKAGGGTVKKILARSAQRHKLTAWIPCENTHCIPFSLPPSGPKKQKAVYASHINYVHMTNTIRELGPKNWFNKSSVIAINVNSNETKHNVEIINHSIENEVDHRKSFGTCLTNIRPTISRVTSCWNYRMLLEKSWTIPSASKMSVEEWNILLPKAVDTFGNGCNNEMARIFGSTEHEYYVNHLSIEADGERYYLKELDNVMSRMAGCVIINVDRCEDSNTILKHYLPWVLNGSKENLCSLHSNANRANKEKKDLTDDAKKVILSHNSFDESVFKFGEKLFEEQLRVAIAAVTGA